MIKILQTQVIPAVGNTHELQNQKFEASKWFMEMATSVNSRVKDGVTAQGFYVAGADGKGYGFNNNRTPDRVIDFLQRGMAGFKKDPPAKVEITDDAVNSKFARVADPSVSILQVYSRIKPMPQGCDELNQNIGREFLWIYPEEIQAIRENSLPSSLSRRLVRFHLVDNIRGEPEMWKPGEIKRSDFSLKRLGSNRYAITGSFSMNAGARGLEGTLEAEMTLHPKEDRIAGFKGFASTTAWGAGAYTPRPPAGKFPILFAIVPATADYAKVTPPTGALYGDWDYRKPN